jgi:hypothetical protein
MKKISIYTAQVLVTLLLLPLLTHKAVYADGVCPDGQKVEAGGVCSDGVTIPDKDPALPLHCPGSAQQGPIGPTYSVTCPARTGRVQCVYTEQDGLYKDFRGRVVFEAKKEQGTDVAASTAKPVEIDKECDNINDPTRPCQMLVYLKNGINFLSAVAGIAITFSLIWAGYQYMTARANAGIVTAAKNRIIMTLVALLLYIFMYAILNWLIPGGLFP